MTAEIRRTLKEAVDAAVRQRLPRCAVCSAIVITDAPLDETAFCSRACRLAERRAAASFTSDPQLILSLNA